MSRCQWFFILLLLHISDAAFIGPRIVGGSNANITDYPYQVSIQYNGLHGCGGSILNKKYILTAAHCTDEVIAENLSIRVGSSFRNQGGKVYQVAEMYVHPNYNSTTYDYDVAVLRLSAELTFGIGVQAISLATSGTIISDGILAIATGWGLTNDGGKPSHQLQVVSLPTISRETCATYYRSSDVTTRMFCAGYNEGGKDTCTGDSGGPLAVSGILIGVTSWGMECAAAKLPGAYTSIPFFRDYIDPIINESR